MKTGSIFLGMEQMPEFSSPQETPSVPTQTAVPPGLADFKQKSRMTIRRTLLSLCLLLVISGTVLAFFKKEAILDWWKLRSFVPSATITKLVDETTMTPYARSMFYVNSPVLESRTDFNRDCSRHSEQAVVLGCYHGNRQGIFLYDVTDNRLDGVVQVTAAHEMLHQAYDRLSHSDRERINRLLQSFFDIELADASVRDQIAAYKKTEPADLLNEMHSVFGTEIASLPVELETYYKRYFTDRSKVAAYSAHYTAEFTNRKNTVRKYDQILKSLKIQIDEKQSDINNRKVVLLQRKAELEADSNEGNIAAFNSKVAGYNALVNAYNKQIDSIQSFIIQYNQILQDRNAIAFEENQLQQAIDSRFTPVSGQ